MKHVHQDDDGFESLNGNVSSDNDKSTTQTTVEKLKQKRDLLKNNERTYSLVRRFYESTSFATKIFSI